MGKKNNKRASKYKSNDPSDDKQSQNGNTNVPKFPYEVIVEVPEESF